MSLVQLSIKNVRNLEQCHLKLNPRFNIIEGSNASGKTSLLEAIHLISQVKSFRTHRINLLIQHSQPDMQVVAQYCDHSNIYHKIGLGRTRSKTKLHLNKEVIGQSSVLASLVPLQVITPESHRLLEDGPKLRRQFLDWGVFHVKHNFLSIWKDYHRILRQRNAALRQGKSKEQVISWNSALIESTAQFHSERTNYLNALLPTLQRYIQQLIEIEITVEYQPGWSKDLSFDEALNNSLENDCQYKHTRVGPHRADLVMKHHGVAVQASLSRGQQKLLVCALRLAQIQYLQSCSEQSCLILVDDLPAELDTIRRKKLVSLLADTGAQVFVTTTDASLLDLTQLNLSRSVFHVEHGNVKEVVY